MAFCLDLELLEFVCPSKAWRQSIEVLEIIHQSKALKVPAPLNLKLPQYSVVFVKGKHNWSWCRVKPLNYTLYPGCNLSNFRDCWNERNPPRNFTIGKVLIANPHKCCSGGNLPSQNLILLTTRRRRINQNDGNLPKCTSQDCWNKGFSLDSAPYTWHNLT